MVVDHSKTGQSGFQMFLVFNSRILDPHCLSFLRVNGLLAFLLHVMMFLMYFCDSYTHHVKQVILHNWNALLHIIHIS